MGSRGRLDEGVLSLVIPHFTSRLRLLVFSLGALLGHKPEHGLDVMLSDGLRIESGHRRLLLSVDGEIAFMDTPLRYRIRPGDLRVIVPRD
jgi:diacylglycerol kinase family enzyme